MYKRIKRILASIAIITIINLPITINANEYSLNDLIEKGKSFDNKEVNVKGEAIGEALERNDYTWININDTTNAMGIFMKKEDAQKVNMYGGFNQIGDTIEVVGTFNRACKDHGGDMDIHAKKVILVESGKVIKDGISKYKIASVIITSFSVLTIGYILYKKIKQ